MIGNDKGQGVIEYLILVAMLGVASIGIVRKLQTTTNTQFANVINGMRGKGPAEQKKVNAPEAHLYDEKDMSDFMKGTIKRAE